MRKDSSKFLMVVRIVSIIILTVMSADIFAGHNSYVFRDSETVMKHTELTATETTLPTQIILTTEKALDKTEPPTVSETAKPTDKTEPPTEIDTTIPPEEPDSDVLTLRFGGDITMSYIFDEYLNTYGIDYSFASVSELTKSADITFFNLETSVSERGASTKPNGFGFRSLPQTLKSIVNAGIDLVTCANNHSIDYGFDAFDDTLSHLNEYGIIYTGIGKNINEANELKIIEKNGIKVGFLAYTQIVPFSSWIANEETGGVNPLLTAADFKCAEATISAAKKICDVLVINIHFGKEYVHTPTDLQTSSAYALIDFGADIIVGHHPHYLQGIEFYNGKPIFYSTGNFVFYKYNDQAGKTALFEITIDKNGFVDGRLYPVHLNGARANLLSRDNWLYADILKLMSDISAPFGTIIDLESGSFKKTD